jgi:F-type H+-transporting ATPase subunit beta
MTIRRTGRPILVPVGPSSLGRLFNVLGEPLDGGAPLDRCEGRPIHRLVPALVSQRRGAEFLETGIKIIDLLAPLPRGARPA